MDSRLTYKFLEDLEINFINKVNGLTMYATKGDMSSSEISCKGLLEMIPNNLFRYLLGLILIKQELDREAGTLVVDALDHFTA